MTSAPDTDQSARTRRHVELPHRPLAQIAHAMIGRRPGIVFLDGGGTSAQARWSLLGWRPRRVVAWPQGKTGALDALRRCVRDPSGASAVAPDQEPAASWAAGLPFYGGWMGWFSYDLGRHFERLPALAARDLSIPDFVIAEYAEVLIEDRAEERLYVAGRGNGIDDDGLRAKARHLIEEADGNLLAPQAVDRLPPLAGPRPMISRAEYRRCVERVLRHIRDGDIYQANFSHRFCCMTSCDSATVYRHLRRESPAPFGCYMDLPGSPEILSASPELFLRKTNRRLQTRPIKGTRPRHREPAADAALREELAASSKENAELLMITDLLRNDLGRVAEYGTVSVESLRELESHPTVHHAYSVIEATLRNDLGVAEVIAATVPGGSVTGAPKIRAMQILDELEPLRRGPYTGVAGYIGDDGDLCLNILIRTLVRQGSEIWYQVGGGIVADSDPDAEYEESMAKGAALRRALIAAARGPQAPSGA